MTALSGIRGRDQHSVRVASATRLLVSRVLLILVIMLAVAIATFAMVRLIPGDPAQLVAGRQATAGQVAAVRRELGLEGSLAHQLGTYLGRLVQLDLGSSYVTGQPVTSILRERLPYTAELVGTVLILVFVIALPLGIGVAVLTAGGKRRALDVAFGFVTSVGVTLPAFLAGTFLVYLFAVKLGWLPVAGANGPQYIILPAVSVAISPAAALSRVVRVETDNALALDFAKLARSKHLPPIIIYVRHILRNVVGTSLAVAGIFLSSLLGGTVVVESVFSWPGLGSALVQGVLSNDYPVIQGIVLALAFIIIVVNVIIDIAVKLLDPRQLGT